MTRTEMWIAAYFIIGIGYHYGQTFTKTWGWNIPVRWVLTVIFWPGVVLAHFIAALGRK